MKSNAPAATKAEKDRIKHRRLFLEVGYCICCWLRFGRRTAISKSTISSRETNDWVALVYTLPLMPLAPSAERQGRVDLGCERSYSFQRYQRNRVRSVVEGPTYTGAFRRVTS